MRKNFLVFMIILSILIVSFGCGASANSVNVQAASLTDSPTTDTTVLSTSNSNSPVYADYPDISDWAKDGVLEAHSRGLMEGSIVDGKRYFNPKGLITFGEAITLVLNMVNNKDLDIKENMEKLGYPSVNLWQAAERYEVPGNVGYYDDYLMNVKKVDYDEVGIRATVLDVIPSAYNSIRYEIENPDISLDWFWPQKTYRQIAGNYVDLNVNDQIKYCIDMDHQRMTDMFDDKPELKIAYIKRNFYYEYMHRLTFPNGVKGGRIIETNTFDERAYAQSVINEHLYPKLQDSNNWVYAKYTELIKYMYLNGIIDDENITFSTPIRKDQFVALMYWTLAVSGQTFDWSGQPAFATGKYLEYVSPGFHQFSNLPTDVTYVYASPLNQLKEINIIAGDGNGTVSYGINIPREQVALIINRLYDYTKDHSKMKRYVDFTGRKNLTWYETGMKYPKYDFKSLPYDVGTGKYNMIYYHILYDLRLNWIGK